ncbi:MAG: hypothetical protein LBL41_03065 [Bifidobacteriaceae bacterium]|nr:hypothetical protein [Bifidobacteriaceae bacterium]
MTTNSTLIARKPLANLAQPLENVQSVKSMLKNGTDIIKTATQTGNSVHFVSFIASQLIRLGEIQGMDLFTATNSCTSCVSNEKAAVDRVKCAGCVFYRA